jgi:hypothetical protein
MVRTVLLAVLLVAFGAITPAAAQHPLADPAGMYNCSGTNPDGSVYSAVVQIIKVDKTYRVLWVLPDTTWVMGVGILSGDVLAVSYFGNSPAIVIYRQEGDHLAGLWTVGGREGAVYTETLTPMDHPAPKPAEPSTPIQLRPPLPETERVL